MLMFLLFLIHPFIKFWKLRLILIIISFYIIKFGINIFTSRITNRLGCDVFRFRSTNNIVKAPANTGKESKSNNDVTTIDQTNKVKYSIFILDILNTVAIKLIEPNKEESPAICKEIIVISTDIPVVKVDKGG